MEAEYDNRDAPSYLAHYGMHRPPFATQTEDDMYYSEPTRTKRLDILLHLTQFGNELLLVTGPEGSGKTSLMRRFLKNAQNNWKICSINSSAKMDEEQLLYRICHCFNLQVESAALPFVVTNVKRQLDQMLATSQTVVIAIDDGHTLSSKVLSLLADLSKLKNQQSGAYLRIVIFAESQIKIQFATIELENRLKYPMRKIDLPPFDEKQTGELIRYRAKMAGLLANNTFTEATVSKIYKQSEGLPGNIVDLAHRVLFEMTPLKRRTKQAYSSNVVSAATKSTKPLGLIAGLVLVVVITLILLFQDEINRLYTHSRGKPAKHTVRSVEIPDLPAKDTDNDNLQQLESAADSAPKPENSSAPPNTETVAVFAKDIDSENKTANKPAKTPSSPPSENISSNAQTANGKSDGSHADGVQPPMSNNVSSLKNVPATETGGEPLITDINQEAWVLEQDPNYFTLQLVAGYQKSTINNFLKQHKISGDKLAYFHSLNKGKDWNSLIYGVYPDYRSALTAIDELPASVRKAHPWIRQLKSVQMEIKEVE